MPYILLIETSTEVCSVALSCNEKIVASIETIEGFNHSEKLAVFIDELLTSGNLKPSDIDAVCASKGPGSYTGLRIGVSAAKGICYGLQIPLLSVSTIDTLALHVSQNYAEYGIGPDIEPLLCPMIDARRMEVYTALYNSKGENLSEISSLVIDKNSFIDERKNFPVVFFGNGAHKCKSALEGHNSVFIDGVNASARFMVEIAYRLFNEKKFEDIAYFEPFYLKNFVATIPKNKIF